MRARRALPVLAVALAAGAALASCRGATQASIAITTDFPCGSLKQTRIFTGAAPDEASVSPTTETPACTPDEGGGGRVGSLTVVPTKGSDGRVHVRVVAGIDRPATECFAPKYAGCVVARRTLSYVPHASLTVPIAMLARCKDVPCDESTTCSRAGRCVSAEVRAGCDEPGGCALPDDTLDAGGALDGSSDGAGDAAEAADAAIDAAADGAKADAGPDVVPSGSIVCGASTCKVGSEICCVDTALGQDVGCAAPSDACPGANLFCDDASDCGGLHCCFDGSVSRCTGACAGVSLCVDDRPGGCPAGTACSAVAVVEIRRRTCR